MGQHRTTRTVTTRPWLALVTALAAVVGVGALVSALLVQSGPSNPQDAIARIPVSTATPYPYATTATPWETQQATPTQAGPTTTTQALTTIGPGPAPASTDVAPVPTAPALSSQKPGSTASSNP